MKYLFFLFIPLIIGNANKTEYIILCNQDFVNFSVPRNEQDFWKSSEFFDTIIIKGQIIIDRLEKEISRFKKISPNSKINSVFSIKHAIIRHKGYTEADTIYTGGYFDVWKINGELFEDKKKFFHKMLSDLTY